RNDELKSATRKATIVKDSYLRIQDVVETNDKQVDLRWNMVTPAIAEVVDEHTIKLTQNGQSMLLKVDSKLPFEVVVRPSEEPTKVLKHFEKGTYEDYNKSNPGTVMVGFDSKIPANTKAKFTVTLIEG